MTILAALRTRLLSQPALTALVGQQVYSLRMPVNVVQQPLILLQEVDRFRFNHARGGVRLYRSRVQMDAVVLSGNGALQKAHAVADAANGGFVNGKPTGLWGFRGVVEGIDIAGVLAADQRERYESGVEMVKVELDYFVWFREPAN